MTDEKYAEILKQLKHLETCQNIEAEILARLQQDQSEALSKMTPERVELLVNLLCWDIKYAPLVAMMEARAAEQRKKDFWWNLAGIAFTAFVGAGAAYLASRSKSGAEPEGESGYLGPSSHRIRQTTWNHAGKWTGTHIQESGHNPISFYPKHAVFNGRAYPSA